MQDLSKCEDKELCTKCGGKCCKKSGCDFFVSDFTSLKMEYLEQVLDTNRVSIVAALMGTVENGQEKIKPILYLRARNVERDAIDLLSYKKTCASLESNGCYFDVYHRPSGGVSLQPSKDGCYQTVDLLKELKKWLPYQDVLRKIVKKRTGKTYLNKLKEDIENLFVDYVSQNFAGISEIELLDVEKLIPTLMKTNPKEYSKALERVKEKKSNQ